MAARDDRDRELLAPLKLEALTEHEEEHVLGLLIGAIRRSVREPVFRSLVERQLAAARLEALHRHLARRRLHVLPGGRRQLEGLLAKEEQR
jgi:hypothetical protein